MKEQENINYNRIAQAIEYIQTHFKSQPNLDEVAEKMHLSLSDFQRLFLDWAEVNPADFFRFINVEYVKKILKNNPQTTLFDASAIPPKLRVKIKKMTASEHQNLTIHYDFSGSLFGNLIIASTPKGVCYMAFDEDNEKALNDLKSKFPNAVFYKKSDELQQNALLVFRNDWSRLEQVKLHLKGTDFQLKVWENLLKIPFGKLSTYGELANEIGNPNASRAVGTAIGSNPVAFLIPCHRVIQSIGTFGGYMWNPIRKTAVIGWEQAKYHQ